MAQYWAYGWVLVLLRPQWRLTHLLSVGLKLFLIQSGYRVLYSVLMGGILGYWQ